jgi:hypothetical protein
MFLKSKDIIFSRCPFLINKLENLRIFNSEVRLFNDLLLLKQMGTSILFSTKKSIKVDLRK